MQQPTCHSRWGHLYMLINGAKLQGQLSNLSAPIPSDPRMAVSVLRLTLVLAMCALILTCHAGKCSWSQCVDWVADSSEGKKLTIIQNMEAFGHHRKNRSRTATKIFLKIYFSYWLNPMWMYEDFIWSLECTHKYAFLWYSDTTKLLVPWGLESMLLFHDCNK